jgi:hypothetical protein
MACQVKHMIYINDMKVETVKVQYETPQPPQPPRPLLQWPRWLSFFVKKVTVTPELVVWEDPFPWP